eukprot:1285674-Pleurochrysis_carterae.AAC.1
MRKPPSKASRSRSSKPERTHRRPHWELWTRSCLHLTATRKRCWGRRRRGLAINCCSRWIPTVG